MSGRRARELCPQLIFVGGDFKDYQRLGDAAINVLNDFTPLVERISIDEGFADVAGCTHLFGAPSEIAAAVRRRVRVEVGLPISIGVARTKHLAKIASQVAKPDGDGRRPRIRAEFLHDLPVELMWGVGPATKARLAEMGVHTIGQLAKMPGMVARTGGRSRGWREACGVGLEPRPSGNRKTHRRAQSARSPSLRSEGGSLPQRKYLDRCCVILPIGSPLGFGRSLVLAGRSQSVFDSPILPFDHALHNARCADFSDREPCRNRRGACSHGARGSSSRGDHLAPRDIRLTPRETLGRAAGTSAWASRRKAPARY